MSKTPIASDTSTPMLPSELAAAVRAAYEKKATDVVVLDMRTIPSFTDFFLLCTSQSQRQMRAVAEAIEKALLDEGVRPAHIEGTEGSEWILLDYFDFVVHVFTASRRRFYGLDRLWGNAVRIEVPDSPV
jgi:ribosome-associated protein